MPTDPYILALEPNVRFETIVTTGDALPNGSVFGGIPDGIGAYDNGDGTMTVLVNHEWPAGTGIAHGPITSGSYIDRLVIDKTTLEVVNSSNLVSTVMLWDDANDVYVSGTTSFNRFCSGNLASPTAFFNASSGLGSSVQIYMTGEESGTEGRATATLVTGPGAGTLYELPSLGNMAYENVVANPLAQDKTIVAMTDDGQNGQVYIYVGTKQATGTEIEKAGLSGGDFYGIKVNGVIDESNGTPVNGTFTLQEIGPDGDVSNMTGLQIDQESEAEGVTSFLRPEDFSWDPSNPSVAYFATTNSFSGSSRIYKITFADISNPTAGGTIEMIVDGAAYGAHMFDNLTVSADGTVIVQEDPGNNSYVARVWQYDPADGSFSAVGTFNPDQFAPGGSQFITQDEESSGVVDVTNLLGDADTNAYLLDAQVHALTGDPATIEGGQLLVMYVDDPFLIGGNKSDNLFGSAANEVMRGNNGNDVALAGSGDDSVYGGNGNDILYGMAGNDRLFGDNGNDRLNGGAGDDYLSGGKGDDYFVFDNSGETGNDEIVDFQKGDRILTTVQLSDSALDFSDDDQLNLAGSSGVTINGGSVDHLIYTGTVMIDGVTYYSYGLDGQTKGATGAPLLHSAQEPQSSFGFGEHAYHDLFHA